MPLVRKITIGKEYVDNAMHYQVGQQVYGGHHIVEIIREGDWYVIYIQDAEKNIKQWKDFSVSMGISVEYNLEY